MTKETGDPVTKRAGYAMSGAGPDDDSIWSVVERAQEGERQALAELFDRFYDGVYRFAYMKLGSVNDAEEAAQETFTQMVRSIKKVKRQGSSFEAWLFRLARNVCVDEQRKRYRRREDSTPVTPEPSVFVPSAEDLVIKLAEADRLRAMLATLPDEQRRVLELRFGANLSSEDIGTILGKSPGAVRIQQMRALQSLRHVIEVTG